MTTDRAGEQTREAEGRSRSRRGLATLVLLAVLPVAFSVVASPADDAPTADCPQWGGSPSRNNAPTGTNIPTKWTVGSFDRKTGAWDKTSAENIRWVARLGSETYGTPVVAGDKVYCATNNGAGRLRRYPAKVDLGCLVAFRRADGKFLWQYSAEKLAAGRAVDWPDQGICDNPMVEGDRLWIVTNRGEVVCLDTEGFLDGENDGPLTSEASTATDEADVIWTFDMMGRLGAVPHNMTCSSVTAVGDLLLVGTSNGVDDSHDNVPAPNAPSFIALDKRTGKLVWADNSPAGNILHGQWSSPAAAVLGGAPQAIFAGGDGWVYSFLARPTDSGRPELLWKFDANPKESVWEGDGRGDRANIVATPVVADGRVYVVTGHDPEFGEADGRLWCIDPTRRGDVSPTLVFDKPGKPVAPGGTRSVASGRAAGHDGAWPSRTRAADLAAGDVVKPNPNSAAIWLYTGHDGNGDGELAFEERMHRSLGMVAVKDGLLVVADLAGLVHCLDAKTGRLHWTHDVMANVWGSPLLVDGKIYLGDEDGDVAVLELSATKRLLSENTMGDSVYSGPVVAGNTLFISTRTRLFAIAAPGK